MKDMFITFLSTSPSGGHPVFSHKKKGEMCSLLDYQSQVYASYNLQQ